MPLLARRWRRPWRYGEARWASGGRSRSLHPRRPFTAERLRLLRREMVAGPRPSPEANWPCLAFSDAAPRGSLDLASYRSRSFAAGVCVCGSPPRNPVPLHVYLAGGLTSPTSPSSQTRPLEQPSFRSAKNVEEGCHEGAIAVCDRRIPDRNAESAVASPAPARSLANAQSRRKLRRMTSKARSNCANRRDRYRGFAESPSAPNPNRRAASSTARTRLHAS
jgi:hypothetical protein